jgi:hypothetical protein
MSWGTFPLQGTETLLYHHGTPWVLPNFLVIANCSAWVSKYWIRKPMRQSLARCLGALWLKCSIIAPSVGKKDCCLYIWCVIFCKFDRVGFHGFWGMCLKCDDYWFLLILERHESTVLSSDERLEIVLCAGCCYLRYWRRFSITNRLFWGVGNFRLSC